MTYPEFCEKMDLYKSIVPLTEETKLLISPRFRVAYAINSWKLAEKVMQEPLTEEEWRKFSDFIESLPR